jgi:hypothetical protein
MAFFVTWLVDLGFYLIVIHDDVLFLVGLIGATTAVGVIWIPVLNKVRGDPDRPRYLGG